MNCMRRRLQRPPSCLLCRQVQRSRTVAGCGECGWMGYGTRGTCRTKAACGGHAVPIVYSANEC